jgi:hypothetical protein
MSWNIAVSVTGPGDVVGSGGSLIGNNTVEDSGSLACDFWIGAGTEADPFVSYYDILRASPLAESYDAFSVNGYRPTRIIIDGVWATFGQYSYTFSGVHADHTLQVVYSQERLYKWGSSWFESEDHPGLTISPPEVFAVVSLGGSLTVTWESEPGGTITWARLQEGDGVNYTFVEPSPIPDPGTYTFENIQGDVGLTMLWEYTAPPVPRSFPWLGKFQLVRVVEA